MRNVTWVTYTKTSFLEVCSQLCDTKTSFLEVGSQLCVTQMLSVYDCLFICQLACNNSNLDVFILLEFDI
jgi:hypothetical protein